MADDHGELRHINWNEIFTFTHIFKSFRMAIHPSKLILGLAAIVLLFVLGQIMGGIWSACGQYVLPDEISSFARISGPEFKAQQKGLESTRPQRAADLASAYSPRGVISQYQAGLFQAAASGPFRQAFDDLVRKQSLNTLPDYSARELRDQAGKDWKAVVTKAGDAVANQSGTITTLITESYDAAKGEVEKEQDKAKRTAAVEQLGNDRAGARKALTDLKVGFDQKVLEIRGESVFKGFLNYESNCLKSAIGSVVQGQLFGGLREYGQMQQGRGNSPAVAMGLAVPAGSASGPGFCYWVLMGVQGVLWLIWQHPLFALIYLLLSLAVWALFGGAIYRIAALHFAREEKISIVQALKFSMSRFLSFLTAPLVPLGVIFTFGLAAIMLPGLLTNIPVVGQLITGVLAGLMIIVGVAIAFLAVGLATGAPLMYPTIAVEGSDAFDAISRSFSYVFAKPWRAALYALVALVYGTFCYLFVRLFAYLALAFTHMFLSWGVWADGSAAGPDANKLDVLWSRPTFDSLFGPFNWCAMSGTEKVGAFMIGAWVFLVAATVAAFLLSYFASSTTTIYYLLRRKVDATDLDDVFVEEAEEPAAPETPAPAAAAPAEAAKPAEGEKPATGEQPAEGQKPAEPPTQP